MTVFSGSFNYYFQFYQIQIFDIENNIKRTSSRSKENVYGARFRGDGKLMVTGGDSGLVQVSDVNP